MLGKQDEALEVLLSAPVLPQSSRKKLSGELSAEADFGITIGSPSVPTSTRDSTNYNEAERS